MHGFAPLYGILSSCAG